MDTLKIKFLLSIFVIIDLSNANLLAGSECTLKNGLSGICQTLNNCGEIYNKFRNGVIEVDQITICNQQMRHVCCPKYIRGEMSELKCKEYGKLVFVETNTTPFQDSNDTVANKCPRQFENNIVGGEIAEKDEFPHQALLGYGTLRDGDWMCGGSLVSSNFVLTAAHCIIPRGFVLKAVKLGMEIRMQNDEETFVFGIKQTFVHPNYKKSYMADIGLIHLDKTVKLNERIFPICLPVTGFGQVGQGPQSNNLLKVELEKFRVDEIEKIRAYNLKNVVDRDPVLFYGHHNLEKDTCKGDSGGPLQQKNHNVYCTLTQIGVVSAGASMCGTPGAPSIFANVFHYLEWIEKIVWADE